MKLLLLGDAHLRLTAPKGRIDDFFATQLGKFEQVLNIADEQKCSIILQVGDLFDSPNPANFVLSTYIDMLLKWKNNDVAEPWKEFYVVLGQHDLYLGSSDVTKTATNVLRSADAIMAILHSNSGYIFQPTLRCRLWGTSFGEVVPEFEKKDNAFDILVIHAAIGYPLFNEHKIKYPEEFLNEHPNYDLIVCGDYHYPFEFCSEGRWIINPGAMVRLTRSSRDLEHKPSVVVFDTENREFERIYLKILPQETAFDLTSSEKSVEFNTDLFNSIQDHDTFAGINFEHNLEQFFSENQISNEIRKIIAETMEEIGVTSSDIEQKVGR